MCGLFYDCLVVSNLVENGTFHLYFRWFSVLVFIQLQNRQHFVENSDMYSAQDLIDLANDVLLAELAKIHSSFAQHIKTDCEVDCRLLNF